MSRIRPARPIQLHNLLESEKLLRHVRELVKSADCPKTTRRVRLALTSLGGAVRHMRHRLSRAGRANA